MPKLSVHNEVIQARGLGAQCLLRVFKALCYLQETQGMGNMLKDTMGTLHNDKGVNSPKGLAILNMYAPNNRDSKYTRQNP